MRYFVLIILALYSLSSYGLSSPPPCMQAAFHNQESEFVINLYKQSDVVIKVSEPIEQLKDRVSKHKVLGVWKGEVGEYVFIQGWYPQKVMFANYVSENFVHETSWFLHYCDYLERALDNEFGSPYKPSSSYFQLNHASNLLLWSSLFIFIIACFINIGLFKWVRSSKPNKLLK
ncbi:hypothetical protein J8Z24_08345 [Pseudoalteromonas sp. SCSIO 43201]|uniref:hypothetical protein n=1 Tax=Pseudoalteromonas sp. SCSIO 43201 TaxID=2822842 RepID=UPI002074D18B|nr:hypothetical protein [Pseudoalteromonas sp. SCSIO 43201]USD30065.1 hypothetical protein J8Z24_08345 [Pseudoalteromonas sp. SCSIO 43201]